MEDHLSLR